MLNLLRFSANKSKQKEVRVPISNLVKFLKWGECESKYISV